MTMPREKGVRAHDRFEPGGARRALRLRLGGQSNALVVGEPETTRTELLSKDAILCLKIINHLALPVVDPACQGDKEKPQRVRDPDH